MCVGDCGLCLAWVGDLHICCLLPLVRVRLGVPFSTVLYVIFT